LNPSHEEMIPWSAASNGMIAGPVFRWLSHILAVGSVLLLALTCGVWARSSRFADAVQIDLPGESWLVSTTSGRVHVWRPSPTARLSPADQLDMHFFSSSAAQGLGTQALRPEFMHGSAVVAGNTIHYIQFPLWAVAAAMGLLPGLRALSAVLRSCRRRNRLLCRSCGYDLRASPVRCPECGLAVGQSPGWMFRRALQGMALLALVGGLGFAARLEFPSSTCPRIALTTLGGFDFDQDKGTLAEVPIPLRALNGHRIELEGNMIPLDAADQINAFALVPNLWGSWQRPPTIQETTVVRLEGGKTVGYMANRVRVRGVLHVQALSEDGYLVQLYGMTADSVTEAPAP
jgi:hypothetical protein